MIRAGRTSGYLVALLLCSASPLGAQVIVGGDNANTSVEVDWSVLDRLGGVPTLPEMLKSHAKPSAADLKAVKIATQAEQNVIFRKLTAHGAKTKAPTLHEPPLHHLPVMLHEPKAVKETPVQTVTTVHKAPIVAPPVVKVSQQDLVKKPEIAAPQPIMPVMAPKPVTAAPVVKETPPAPSVQAPKTPLAVVSAPLPAAPPPPKAPAPVQVAPPSMTQAAPAPASVASLITPPPVAPPPSFLPPAMSALTPPPQPAAQQQIASLPSSTDSAIAKNGDILTILFQPNDSQLPSSANAALTQLAKRLSRDESTTLQLLAYADGDDATVSKARRMSLSRALEVRKFLMDLGVRSTRIEVRALGNKHDGNGPIDRVDALVAAH